MSQQQQPQAKTQASFVAAQPGSQIIYVPQAPIGQDPKQMSCPACQNVILTEVKPVKGLITYLISGALCLHGCWLGCCFIPCCIAGCQDTEHYCPKCKHLIDTHRKL